jgi:hypothetical protein
MAAMAGALYKRKTKPPKQNKTNKTQKKHA